MHGVLNCLHIRSKQKMLWIRQVAHNTRSSHLWTTIPYTKKWTTPKYGASEAPEDTKADSKNYEEHGVNTMLHKKGKKNFHFAINFSAKASAHCIINCETTIITKKSGHRIDEWWKTKWNALQMGCKQNTVLRKNAKRTIYFTQFGLVNLVLDKFRCKTSNHSTVHTQHMKGNNFTDLEGRSAAFMIWHCARQYTWWTRATATGKPARWWWAAGTACKEKNKKKKWSMMQRSWCPAPCHSATD